MNVTASKVLAGSVGVLLGVAAVIGLADAHEIIAQWKVPAGMLLGGGGLFGCLKIHGP